jgi:hypothetical protein
MCRPRQRRRIMPRSISIVSGAYHTELEKDDVTAGAIYDRGVYIYAMSRMDPLNDDMGATSSAT